MKGGTIEKGREGEGVGLYMVGQHLGVVRKSLVVETGLGVGVDYSGPLEHVWVVGAVEEGYGVVEVADGGVAPLKLEV